MCGKIYFILRSFKNVIRTWHCRHKRITEHNKTCAIKSSYGVVPAYDPNHINDVQEMNQDFKGYTDRLNNGKCIFKLENRCIEYTDDNGMDINAMIIRDIGAGMVLSQDHNNIKRMHKLKDLRYHNTRRIWRNYR